MSFVVVLPVAPVMPTTRAVERSRTAPPIAASAACGSSGTSAAAAPRASACATKSAPAADRDEEVALLDPPGVDLHAGHLGRPRPGREPAERLDQVELERDHRCAATRPRMLRATSRSSNGTLPVASSCSGSAPRPAITTISSGPGLRERELDRGAAVELLLELPERAGGDLGGDRLRGPRERGLSEVRIARSASSDTTRPISGRLPRSRSPPAPNTTVSRPSPRPRAARMTFSSESGVWA